MQRKPDIPQDNAFIIVTDFPDIEVRSVRNRWKLCEYGRSVSHLYKFQKCK